MSVICDMVPASGGRITSRFHVLCSVLVYPTHSFEDRHLLCNVAVMQSASQPATTLRPGAVTIKLLNWSPEHADVQQLCTLYEMHHPCTPLHSRGKAKQNTLHERAIRPSCTAGRCQNAPANRYSHRCSCTRCPTRRVPCNAVASVVISHAHARTLVMINIPITQHFLEACSKDEWRDAMYNIGASIDATTHSQCEDGRAPLKLRACQRAVAQQH